MNAPTTLDGLKTVQRRVLRYIADHPGSTSLDIAQVLDVAGGSLATRCQTVRRIIYDLEARMYIQADRTVRPIAWSIVESVPVPSMEWTMRQLEARNAFLDGRIEALETLLRDTRLGGGTKLEGEDVGMLVACLFDAADDGDERAKQLLQRVRAASEVVLR